MRAEKKDSYAESFEGNEKSIEGEMKSEKEDPVIDKSLVLYETWDRIQGTKWAIQGEWNESQSDFLKRIFKESKSTAIADFILELRKWADTNVPIFGQSEYLKFKDGVLHLLKYAEELKEKI